MQEAIWATWYDLEPDMVDDFIGWAHSNYLPFLKSQPGFSWVAHYRNVGPGPSLAQYHSFAGHSADHEALPPGSQFVLLIGAPATHTFYHPLYSELPRPPAFAAQLARMRNARTVIFAEEMRVNGPEIHTRLPGATPAPAIQFGTYRIRSFEEESSLNCWYARERFPLMSRLPGSVMTRKLLSSLGWAKHGILYEFASLAARTEHFEEPHEAKVVDPSAWVGKVVRSTQHTPGSPVVGERIWPAVDEG